MTQVATTAQPAVIGVDIGGTKSLGVVMDAGGNILVEDRWETRGGAAALVDLLAEITATLTGAAGPGFDIRGVGVGIAGLVDLDGCLRRAPNLADADDFAIREQLESKVHLPVTVDNDANCAARAELHLGAARGVEHALLITLGTGVGGALIADGAVVRGAAGMAGEPGHIMVDPNGPACPCGLSGCWEGYASGSGLAYLARRAADRGGLSSLLADAGGESSSIRGEHVTAAARQGNAEAIAVLEEFAWWVSVGMANCAALSDPELIVVGGGLVRDWDLYGPRVVELLGDKLVAASHRPPLRVEPAQAGEAAGALGAGYLVAAATGVEV